MMTETSEIIYLDAVLRPNRSLSERGFAIGMAIVAVVFFLTGLMFYSMGAVPILGAAAVLVGAAVVAALMPAARASRVDVLQALRSE